MSGVSEAFAAAVMAIGAVIGQTPLPKGLNQADVGDWTMALNASGDPIQHDGQELGPWTVLATHKQFFVIALLDPTGGVIGGGMPEGEFIDQMQSAMLAARGAAA